MRRGLIHTKPTSSLFPLDSPSRQVLTVSALTAMVRTALETSFSEVWLEGEISNLRAPGSGHLYCTLKDQTSQIRAVIFRSTAIRLRFGLEDGLHVIVRGRVSVYEPRGEYQVILDHVEPRGLGALQLAFEQLKRRLEDEGLFDVTHKRSLPAFPRTVGLVTSATGAAVRDMVAVLHRRCPIVRIILVPVSVQGDGSAEQIVAAIEALNSLGSIDVIIVGRGGGSLEDLWSFNEEPVVRAVAASAAPIVSAVGHETDVTLTDFAADVRAPTPSAAAELVVPVLAELVERLDMLIARCRQAITTQCLDQQQRLDLVLAHMGHIRLRILKEAQRVDDAVAGMRDAAQATLRRSLTDAQAWTQALMSHNPIFHIRLDLGVIPQLRSRLTTAMDHVLTQRMQLARGTLWRLNGLSPLAVLERGYAILETVPRHQIIREVEQVAVGDEVVARLTNGQVRCTVNGVRSNPSVLNRTGASL
ncbi:MAG: exodeoxyribonuclease VII large subunit [Nitrospira sp.]|nr:exodeoxyribonuclease VII large subunit [Nitrospira sp.]MDH5195057.1 exodeoxyribonuclease VII large subunit [Nitrospira sp.]